MRTWLSFNVGSLDKSKKFKSLGLEKKLKKA